MSAAYLPSAYAENPMQEAFFVVLLDRKDHPLGRHMVTLETLTSSLVHNQSFYGSSLRSRRSFPVWPLCHGFPIPKLQIPRNRAKKS
jgi:hypothetical protein